MSIEVIAAGAQTMIQDAGRLGHYHDGMAPGGPQDSYSFRVANLLVGNGLSPRLFSIETNRGPAGLEITINGPTLRFREPTTIAITGAEMRPVIDGNPIEMWRPVKVSPGAVLACGMTRQGARAYLAVAGGIDVPPVLGSRATCLVARCGGIKGRPLKAGDVLPVGRSQQQSSEIQPIPGRFRIVFAKEPVLRVVLGPQDHLFLRESVQAFLEHKWTMSPVSNRMGFRFDGPQLGFHDRAAEVVRDSGSDPSNIVDDVIPVGGIQVPGGKQAIVMGVEAPSVGGYAKIATVISADFGLLGQIRPGQSIRFVSVKLSQAYEAIMEEEARLAELANGFGLPLTAPRDLAP